MNVRNILTDVKDPLESHEDARGCITDIFYNENINHVAYISSKAGSKRGDHWHKETTQHILIVKGTMQYWYKGLCMCTNSCSKMITVGPNDLITTPPFEIHTLRFPTDVDFIVFSTGKRGGKDYESDTIRIKSSIVRES